MKFVGSFQIFFFASALVAQTQPVASKPQAGSKVEQGARKDDKPDQPPKDKIAAIKELPNCTTYDATPIASAILSFEKKIYFTSPKLPSDSGAATNYLIEVDLKEGKARRVAGFKSGEFVSLVAHDPTPKAISFLDFSNGKPECGEGLTSGTAIQLSEQKATPSFPAANYAIVPGDSLVSLGDIDKGIIQALDIATGQKRTLETFRKGTRPLYLKVSPPTVLFAYDPGSRELSKYIASKKQPDSKLKLKEGMRLVQDGERFGVVTKSGANVQISEIKGWSGEEMRSHDIELSPEFASLQPSILARFDSDEFLVLGKDGSARKALKTIVYFEEKRRIVFKAPDAKSYFSDAAFLSDGSIGLLLSESDSDVVREFWVSAKGGEPKKIDILKIKKPAVKAMAFP